MLASVALRLCASNYVVWISAYGSADRDKFGYVESAFPKLELRHEGLTLPETFPELHLRYVGVLSSLH